MGMESMLEGLFQRRGREMEDGAQEDMQSEVQDLTATNEVSSVTDEEEVKRFNDYMDAVYRRMNAALRAKLMDPMELNLEPKDEKKGKEEKKVKDEKKGKSGKRKKRVTRDAEAETETEVEVAEEEEQVDRIGELGWRMGDLEKGQKKNKKKNGKKNGKGKSEKIDGDETEEKKQKKKSGKNKNKRKEAKQQKKAEKAARKAQKLAKKTSQEAKRKNKTEENEEVSREKRNKNSNDSKNKQRRKKSQPEPKARGSLSGIATLRRSGDVTISDEEDHKIISSEFAVGPLQLEVSKSFGEAKQRKMKSAKASTDVMKGVMALKVKPDGSAHVKKVVFKKPDHVDVSGSIADKERKSDAKLRNSFNRSRGLAVKKILKTARYVLKTTEQ